MAIFFEKTPKNLKNGHFSIFLWSSPRYTSVFSQNEFPHNPTLRGPLQEYIGRFSIKGKKGNFVFFDQNLNFLNKMTQKWRFFALEFLKPPKSISEENLQM